MHSALSCCWATAQLLQRLLSAQAAEAEVPLQLKNSGYATGYGGTNILLYHLATEHFCLIVLNSTHLCDEV
jgi:hypothetical protein